MKASLEEVQNILSHRNYSVHTKRTYIGILKQYFGFCQKKNLNVKESCKTYIKHLINLDYSISTQNQAINAIKFYLEKIEGMERMYIEIDRPMKERSLPTVLSLAEVKSIFSHVSNMKQRTILKVVYACGLRSSEVINLKLSDINGDRMLIHIRKGKGRKDRIVPMPETLLQELRAYYKIYRPIDYLFEGQGSNNVQSLPYSASSLRQVIKRAKNRVGIRRTITLHTLRHSYATHMYEHGIELRSIQMLLGHSSSRTTEIYTHVANRHLATMPSPLDFLDAND